MFRSFFNRNFYKGVSLILVASLLSSIAKRNLSLTRRHIQRCAVDVTEKSYYQLDVDGKPAAYFSNYTNSTFVDGSLPGDSIRSRMSVTEGYWVNKLPILPSCFGRIAVIRRHYPSTIINLKDQKLRQVLMYALMKMDIKLVGLQSKRNETAYYLRVHSVQDYGYNKIADYHTAVIHQIDSLQRIIHALQDIKPTARLRIRQVNQYTARVWYKPGEIMVCNRLNDESNRWALCLQTSDCMTPWTVSSRFGRERGMQESLRDFKAYSHPVLGFPAGALIDSAGYYVGEQRGGKAEGYGQYYGNDGSFYDGHWQDGKRNGFGINVAPHDFLKVGEWKNNVFKGERLTYNADRIYGIDLSKHQHEKGEQRYSIAWSKLRITHLGTLSSKKVEGIVDYPVSFAYVKATEGRTLLNNYYYSDYLAARQQGIRVGSYHFFSTLSSGYMQANFFLKKARFRKGDLPPVLDVEPTDAQIHAMGGAEVLFKQVRIWMSMVFKHTGHRPILYISQSFANRYMPLAPDLGDNYLVWIARYGEYKPNFKLAYWQLSPDGKVHGIHGDVDINVFNGYRNQYEDFLKRHCF